jgi:mitochondrial enoyl-[acyl-carrier protein] reductase / trans-2-enoyl-CoA reductase
MQAIQVARFGAPDEAAELVELPTPAAGPGEVVVTVLATPINPADLALLEGSYGASPPPLPSPIGAEGVGTITALGAGVTHLKLGDRVLLLSSRDNWREQVVCPAERLFPLPQNVDLLQLAMLKVNPPTALRMLTTLVPLKAGDWVLQNAANSGVGLCVIALAKTMDLRTLSIVRRAEAAPPLLAAGGDVVLVDGDDLAARVATATGGGHIPLALDAIGGAATERLAASLSDGGTVVNYGLLSGEPCRVAVRETIFRDITLRGFWLARWLREAPPHDIRAIYERLLGQVADGTLVVPVAATYPLRQYREALRHAGRGGRDGKVLFTPH